MIEIKIPRLGWSMDEGTLAKWLKQPGEFVAQGDFIFELEGEKAVQEIESFDSGVLCIPADAAQPGEIVQVGQVIGFLLAADEVAPASVGIPVNRTDSKRVGADNVQQTNDDGRSAAESRPRVAGPAARRLAQQLGIDLNDIATPDPTGRVTSEDVLKAKSGNDTFNRTRPAASNLRLIASPRARRYAREQGVDLRQIKGMGRGGRIRERDVDAFIKRLGSAPSSRSSMDAAFKKTISPTVAGVHHAAAKVRQTLAQRMFAGVHQTAPVTLTTKVDASALVSCRKNWRAANSVDKPPTYNDMLVKLTAVALKEQSQLNAVWHDDGIWVYDQINLAIGVDLESGLVAPVIRNADQLTLTQISECSETLIQRAKSGSLSQSDIEGGTFTVTNLGMFDIDSFTPIINLPQAAILGVGRIVQEPVVRDHQIVIGQMLTLSLTFDHRVTDGAPAARWLQRLGALIQSAEEVFI
ncbi:MAG: 2-oxo acid dehydrogenase subunit E2 [Planctomycetaceae bacterium]|nr:2-oxo acid dehydrogenase subunit E2 [Planctomycetaceae bacterium]